MYDGSSRIRFQIDRVSVKWKRNEAEAPFRCRDALSLLRAFSISHEVRDVYLEPKLMEELIDRMQLEPVRNNYLFIPNHS